MDLIDRAMDEAKKWIRENGDDEVDEAIIFASAWIAGYEASVADEKAVYVAPMRHDRGYYRALSESANRLLRRVRTSI